MMTHRAHVQRDTQGTVDEYGQYEPAVWVTHIASLACKFYTSSRMEQVAQTTQVVSTVRLMIPVNADVSERDRIVDIRDRLGAVIETGPWNVKSVEYKRSHRECLLVEVEA